MKLDEFEKKLRDNGIQFVKDWEIDAIVIAPDENNKAYPMSFSGLIVDHDNKQVVVKLKPKGNASGIDRPDYKT